MPGVKTDCSSQAAQSSHQDNFDFPCSTAFRDNLSLLTAEIKPAKGEAYLDYSRPLTTNALTLGTNCIVNFFDIKPLLRPTHPFFKDKQGFIEDYAAYKTDPDSEHFLLYPKCKYEHRNNPYRRFRLSRSNTARTFKKLNDLKEACHLAHLKFINLDLTLAKELSQWLDQQPGGLEMAWRLFSKWLDNCLAELMPKDSAMAVWAVLHFWGTKDPLEPHFHFHICLLNYVEVPAFDDPENGQTYKLVERLFPVNEDGKRTPFTKAQLAGLRAGSRRLQANFAYRHRIDTPSLALDQEADLYVAYLNFNKPDDTPRIINRLKYMTRPPIVDYARVSNKKPHYPDPTELILKYTTRLRTFGFARRLKGLIGEVNDSEICKLSPLTGKKMEYIARYTREEVLYHAGGKLGRLDFRKGKPILGELTEQELNWLQAVDYVEYPNPGWYEAHRDDPAALLAPRPPP